MALREGMGMGCVISPPVQGPEALNEAQNKHKEGFLCRTQS